MLNLENLLRSVELEECNNVTKYFESFQSVGK